MTFAFENHFGKRLSGMLWLMGIVASKMVVMAYLEPTSLNIGKCPLKLHSLNWSLVRLTIRDWKSSFDRFGWEMTRRTNEKFPIFPIEKLLQKQCLEFTGDYCLLLSFQESNNLKTVPINEIWENYKKNSDSDLAFRWRWMRINVSAIMPVITSSSGFCGQNPRDNKKIWKFHSLGHF